MPSLAQSTTSPQITYQYIPEMALLLAILQRAALDFHALGIPDRYSEKNILKKRAHSWIFAPIQPKAPPFSFAWICEQLDIEPLTTQQRIANFKNESSIVVSKSSGRWLSLAGQFYDNDYRDLID